ncbi:MAG: hypothetical protein M1828_002452 [Chrysothrix sp. TS-e1954]|nr:MAG: hypothetical protein M1828_002452 [Chrysothrix sp. TS-e1954]
MVPEGFDKIWQRSSRTPKSLQFPAWRLEDSIESVENSGTSHAILSLGHQIPHLVEDTQRVAALCHDINKQMAAIRDKHPARFGFFATLPSPIKTSDCQREIAHAIDVLGADGVVLATSYEGRYLGDARFRPIWQDLDARGSVVLVHPGLDDFPGVTPAQHPLPRPIIDWSHEITRTATHLIASDTKRLCSRCKIILPQGGGTLPFVTHRMAHLASQTGGLLTKSAADFIDEAKSFYFDVTGIGFDEPLTMLMRFANPERVLYGSDFPFVRKDLLQLQNSNIDRFTRKDGVKWSLGELAASALFPRLMRIDRCVPSDR